VTRISRIEQAIELVDQAEALPAEAEEAVVVFTRRPGRLLSCRANSEQSGCKKAAIGARKPPLAA
jgi:hypothetical protein